MLHPGRVAIIGLLLTCPLGRAAEPVIPPGDKEPVLQLEAGGPTAAVTALAFGPKGRLYAAGYDKVVRAWKPDAKGAFTLDAAYRVPIGPGIDGALNALALSPDGRWLAVAGTGVVRETAGFRQPGIVVPRVGRLTPTMLEDQGTIWVFDTTRPNAARPLRGQLGPVLSLRFAPARAGKPPLLIAVAREPEKDKHVGRMRLWSLAEGKGKDNQLAVSPAFPDPGAGRPGLAAWHVGGPDRAVAVAIACLKHPPRLWDVARNDLRPLGPLDKGVLLNDTIAFLPWEREGGGTLLTGSFREPGAHLQRWNVRGTKVESAGTDPLLIRDGAPRALAIPAAGRPRYLAAVLRFRWVKDLKKEHRLMLIDAATRRPVGAEADLWPGQRKPALAASPDGKLLAVAGGPGHTVEVFTVTARGPKLKQTLQSAGLIVGKADFARKGKERGLILRPRTPTGLGEPLLFDLARRRIVAGRKGWKDDRPDDGIWRTDPLNDIRRNVIGYRVYRGRERIGEVNLKPGQTPTAKAILPPTAPLGRSLLAVAYEETGVPYLGLYDVRSGKQVRQCTGHVNPIRSLSFDAAGRLLVSAADDKTVCVWSLTDLGQTWKTHGRAAGLAVEADGKQLRIALVEGPLREKGLRPRDVLEGMVGPKGLRRFARPHDFYEAMWQTRPGTEVTLQVAGKKDVKFKADQGIDDRKPLFSLFVTEERNRTYEWVGWSPEGPYDTGDLVKGETYIGWHRNTGNPKRPVSFSPAKDYRKDYRREGILKHLVATGNLAAAIDAWRAEPAPEPSMSLGIDGLDPDGPAEDGRLILRRRSLTLRASVYGTPLPKIDTVHWHLDDGPARKFEEVFGREWSAGLGDLKWDRRPHLLRLRVRTVEARPKTYEKSLAVQYLPLGPTVRFDADWLKKRFGDPLPEVLETKEEKLLVRGQATPGDNGPGGPGVRVWLEHAGKTYRADGLRLAREVTLRPGDNVLTLHAANEGAKGKLLSYESATDQIIIRYKPKVVPPPQITLTGVVADGEELALPDKGKVLVVHAPQIRVRGRVSAEDPLTEVARDGKRIAGFKPEDRKSIFTLDESVDLKPGEQKVKFTADVGKVAAEPVTVRVAYHPDLPRLDPQEDRRRTHEAGEPLAFTLQLRLTELRHPYPYKAFIRVGEEKLTPAKVGADGLLTADVKLKPGENDLEVVLKNTFTERTEKLSIYHKRPPEVVKVEEPLMGKKPVVDLVARVRSPKELPLKGVRLNGDEVPAEDLEMKKDKANPRLWDVVVHKVTLREGENAFTLLARNDDGESLKPGRAKVKYTVPKPPARAVVEVLEPAVNRTVEDPRCVFAIRVRSESEVERVRFQVGEKVLDPGKPEEVDGALVYRMEVPLQTGPNTLRALVLNAGGEQPSQARVVSYIRKTIRVVLERLERYDRLERDDKRRKFFALNEEVPVSQVRLYGRAEWPKGVDAHLHGPVRVRVYVNDFEQFSVLLREPGTGAEARTRRFVAELRLNRKVNQVVLEFPGGVKLESNERPKVTVKCANPEKNQRLHLFVFAPDEPNSKKVVANLKKTFLATDNGDGTFWTPAFKEGRIYGPLPWNSTRQGVYPALTHLKMLLRRSTGDLNDVVIVYFHGKEAFDKDHHYLLTAASEERGRYAETALKVSTVREILNDVPGAKMLLLDVRSQEGMIERDRRAFPRVGYFRYVWLGSPDAPQEARLTHQLRKSLVQASELGELKPVLEDWVAQLGRRAGLELLYPPGLSELRLGKGTPGGSPGPGK